jgi:hypothetical protein
LADSQLTHVRLNKYAKQEIVDAAKRGHKSQSAVINDLAQYAKFLYPEPVVVPAPEIKLAYGLRHRTIADNSRT